MTVRRDGDEAVLRLTARFDATERAPQTLRVDPERGRGGAGGPRRRPARVARARGRQHRGGRRGAAEGRAEGDRPATGPDRHAARRRGRVGRDIRARRARRLPLDVLMCAIPARVAGVARLALASPPGPDGELAPAVLAAAALCGVDEVYAMGGAQAIFALAHGTESVAAVDVIAGPGNAWVREAKRRVAGSVGIDSLAGPSELMASSARTPTPSGSPSTSAPRLSTAPTARWSPSASRRGPRRGRGGHRARRRRAPGGRRRAARPGPGPRPRRAVGLANAFAPEHLELLDEDASLLADRISTRRLRLRRPRSATAFGDYVAGSNHVLPTGGAGRFSGPLGPSAFRRTDPDGEVTAEAAARLAPHVDRIARAEGFPVHGESAMIRAEENR